MACERAGSGEAVDDTMTYRYREEKGFIASVVIDNNTFTGRPASSVRALDTIPAATYNRTNLFAKRGPL
ncbi:hypothetical protein [uncultured Oscillibacter sp.]|uniref:hypothetical protein n=1 Tax=uncultured Oscillibacter sp. TaxID=876091 RepID=UPI0025EBF006|nr:hypothetical protein [uncultured Oscillibacter sp.]